MCGIIGYIGSSRSSRSSSTGCGGSNTAATTRRASRSCATAHDRPAAQRRQAGAARRGASPPTPIDGEYGIGHTRWATHGRPTEENAHPHRDCTGRIVVVHNGIIENYLDLKRELQQRGPQVRHRDRHRDRRAPGRARDEGRRPRERRPPRAAATCAASLRSC